MEKIYNIVQFDPDGCYGCERTYYHVKCTEEKIYVLNHYNMLKSYIIILFNLNALNIFIYL